MQLPFEITVALRYMRSRRKAGISLTTLLTIFGVVVGVAALTVVTSVWNGFEAEFLDKLLGINAHSVILRRHDVFRNYEKAARKLRKKKGIQFVAPFVYSEVISQSPKGVQGVAIKGVDAKLARQTPLAKYVERPEQVFADLARSSTVAVAGRPRLPPILIGSDLSEVLHVRRGDPITIISPYGGRGSEARQQSFEIVGVFHSGMFEFDSRMVFINLGEAQRLFRLYKTVTGLEVWTTDPLKSDEIVTAGVRGIDKEDPLAFDVRDWSRTNRGLFGAVRSQKALISIVLFIIVVVAAFNIMATLILLILEKGREIAVLKSLGSSNRSILTIFILDGQFVGIIGCFLGTALGLTICAVLEQYGLKLDPRVYYLEHLPIVARPIELIAINVGAMIFATVATLFPALKAARMQPVEGLTKTTGLRAPTTTVSPPSH